MKKILLSVLLLLAFHVCAVQVSSATSEIYVATNGSDSTGTGTIDKPFATLVKASTIATAGTHVYVRGGTYHQQSYITKGSGSISSPVIYTPYAGEKVILDGTGVAISDPNALIRLYGVDNIIIDGFELANSSGRGLSADHTNNVILRNNIVHDTKYRAIGGDGTNLIIDRNEVYNGSMINANGGMGGGGWPAVVSTTTKKDGSASENVTISNNYIHHSWGEGIDTMSLDGGRVTGNRVQDAFSVSIYLDNARNIVVDGNYITATNPTYFRRDLNKPAHGIEIAAESCCRPTNANFESTNITVSNNLIVGSRSALRYWNAMGVPYSGVKVYFNTFTDAVDSVINFDSMTTSGNEMRNNIIVGKPSLSSSGWVFSNNNWVTVKPSIDTASNSFSADPLFVNPANTGSVDGYKLRTGSSSIGKGIPVALTNDFFGKSRGTNPTVGFYEFSGSAGSSTAMPNPTATSVPITVTTTSTPYPVATTCPPAGNTGRGIASMTVTVNQAGNYKAWVQMKGKGDAANSIWLQLDGLYCVKVGDKAGMQTGAWTWVDYVNGNTTTKIPSPLIAAGTHTLTLIGNAVEPGVAIDRVLLTKDTSCVPAANGDACIGVVSTPTQTGETPTGTPTGTPIGTKTPTSLPTAIPSPVSATFTPIPFQSVQIPQVSTAPTIKTTSLPNGKKNTWYTASLVATDQTPSDILKMTVSGLPNGISLKTCTSTGSGFAGVTMTCTISGRPSQRKTSYPKFTVRDSVGNTTAKVFKLVVK